MSYLNANDRAGHLPETWYHAALPVLDKRPSLKGRIETDLCVIGAGLTGLNAATLAAQNGLRVVVLDAHRIGFGASARSGGQIGKGFRENAANLSSRYGEKTAHALNAIADRGFARASALAPTSFCPGLIEAVLDRRAKPTSAIALDAAQLAARIGTTAYTGGIFDPDEGACNPLEMLQTLSNEADKTGVQIFERSEVHQVSGTIVRTGSGQVTAKQVVIATNGYGSHLTRATAARLLPINNYIAVTEPLGTNAPMVDPVAVYDTRNIVFYFRQTPDGRLLFGGGESYGRRFTPDIAGTVRRNMCKVYPQLADAKIDYAWGGTLAVTASRLPFVSEIASGVFASGGYSGHGLALACACGEAVAKAALGDRAELDLLSQLKVPSLLGGRMFGPIIANTAMAGLAFMDRLRGF